MEKDNLAQARQITLHYDVPFFERWNHAFWRATLECFGAASRYQRPPAETYSDQQMIQVKAFYQSLGLL